MASRPPGWARCRCAAETGLAAERRIKKLKGNAALETFWELGRITETKFLHHLNSNVQLSPRRGEVKGQKGGPGKMN